MLASSCCLTDETNEVPTLDCIARSNGVGIFYTMMISLMSTMFVFAVDNEKLIYCP